MVIISYAYRIFSSDVCVLTQKPRFGAERAPRASSGKAALSRVGWRPGRHRRPAGSRPLDSADSSTLFVASPVAETDPAVPTPRSTRVMAAPRARQTAPTAAPCSARARNRRHRREGGRPSELIRHLHQPWTPSSRVCHIYQYLSRRSVVCRRRTIAIAPSTAVLCYPGLPQYSPDSDSPGKRIPPNTPGIGSRCLSMGDPPPTRSHRPTDAQDGCDRSPAVGFRPHIPCRLGFRGNEDRRHPTRGHRRMRC